MFFYIKKSKSTYHYFRAVLPLCVVGVVVGLPLRPVGEGQLASAVGPAELALLKKFHIFFSDEYFAAYAHFFVKKYLFCIEFMLHCKSCN